MTLFLLLHPRQDQEIFERRLTFKGKPVFKLMVVVMPINCQAILTAKQSHLSVANSRCLHICTYICVSFISISSFFSFESNKNILLSRGTSLCTFGGKVFLICLAVFHFTCSSSQLPHQTLVRTARWQRNKTFLLYQLAVLCFVCAEGTNSPI